MLQRLERKVGLGGTGGRDHREGCLWDGTRASVTRSNLCLSTAKMREEVSRIPILPIPTPSHASKREGTGLLNPCQHCKAPRRGNERGEDQTGKEGSQSPP